MAIKSVLGIVLAGGAGTRLSPLTADRAKPAVPFGGLYRLIDFALSNLANGGIRKICVLTQYKSHSLDRHISTTWRMSSLLGNYVTPVPAQQRLGPHWYTGSADAIFQSMNLINDERPDIVIVFGADHVYRMDPMQMIDHHVRHGAGVTVAAIPVPRSEASAFGIVSVGPDGRTIDAFLEKPADPPPMPGNPDMSYSSMGNYVFDTDVLVDALRKDADDDSSRHDIGGNIIPNLVRNGSAQAYDFSLNEVPGATPRDAGYWRDVGSLESYFDAHMDLCAVEPIFNLYNDQWPILTYVPSLPPAKFVHEAGDRVGRAIDSLVSPGVVISGGLVRQSVLSPGVRVNSWATVQRSVLLHNTKIGRHAVVTGRDHRQERHRAGVGAGRRGQGPRQGARLRGLGRRHHRGGQGPGGRAVTQLAGPGKLRVALLTREYPPEVYGGAGVHVTYLARELAPLVDLTVHCQGADRPDAVAHRPWDLLADANQALRVVSTDLSMAAAIRVRAAGPLAHLVREPGRPPGRHALRHPARDDDALAGGPASVEGRAAGRRVHGLVLVRADGGGLGRRGGGRLGRHAGRHPGRLPRNSGRTGAGNPQRHRHQRVPARSADRGTDPLWRRPGPPLRDLRRPHHPAEGRARPAPRGLRADP